MKLLAERLQWAMEEKSKRDGTTVIAADIARAAKATNTAASLWLSGGGMSARKARLVAAYLAVNPRWLEDGDGQAIEKPRSKAHLNLVPAEENYFEQYTKQVSELVTLFGASTALGRDQIFGAANDAPKIIPGNQVGLTGDDSE